MQHQQQHRSRQYTPVASSAQQQREPYQQQQEQESIQTQKILEQSLFNEYKKIQITQQQEDTMNRKKVRITAASHTFMKDLEDTIMDALLRIPEASANHKTVQQTLITMGDSIREDSVQLIDLMKQDTQVLTQKTAPQPSTSNSHHTKKEKSPKPQRKTTKKEQTSNKPTSSTPKKYH